MAVFVVLFVVIAIEMKDLIRSAISLGAASAFLAALFFTLEAPYAAVFELSVCAGLITVLLLSAVTLTMKEEKRSSTNTAAVWLGAVLFGIMVIYLVGSFIGGMTAPATTDGGFSEGLWGDYAWATIGIALIMLSGGVGVLSLVGGGPKWK